MRKGFFLLALVLLANTVAIISIGMLVGWINAAYYIIGFNVTAVLLLMLYVFLGAVDEN